MLRIALFAISFASATIVASAATADDTLPTAAERLFVAKVKPLLVEKCIACHGADRDDIKSAFDLTTRDSARRGGESRKPAIVPGNPNESPLYQAVRWQGLEMPPKENDRLTVEQIEVVREWIAAGAPWPNDVPTPDTPSGAWSDNSGIIVQTSGGLTPEWTNRRYKPEAIWAFQPIKRSDIPVRAIDATRIRTPIDAFLEHKLVETGIERFAEPADRRTFIWRATFDLLGLPPTPAEIDAFLTDRAPGARSRLIDRLLADPRYGEQQARYWLDVVRYADTSGFSNDIERPNAWRYRDYVVRSFNADKPYDRFITEQLAGDELDPNDPELLIAVGFLRMGPWEHTDMTAAAVTRQQFLDDVTNHVCVSLLGQALRCASCHDHKFDPIPTREYYRMQAIFAPAQFAERRVPFLDVENVEKATEARKPVEARLQHVRKLQQELRRKSDRAKFAYLRERGVNKYEELAFDKRPPGGNFGREFGLTTTEQSLNKIYEKSIQYLQRELNRFEPRALSVYSGPDNGYHSLRPIYEIPASRDAAVATVHILAGGSIQSPLDAVAPGLLSAMSGSNDTVRPTAWNTVPNTTHGRRLALARWIASPNNTLTARVIVNRVWQQHFGTGIVATPNNFGTMGAQPTHPELLDWLAVWFMEHHWSIKSLHRLIMTSATYQQSGDHPDRDELVTIDPANRLLAYFSPRRLAAEEIRDALLSISGELNPDVGGPGVFPEINWEVAFQPRHIMGSVAPAYVPSRTPRDRNRRTLYAFRYRTLADPLLEVFNRPNSETSCERRDQTTVTPQAFALFNSQYVSQRALAFAIALIGQSTDFDDQLNAAFLRTCGRPPTMEEFAMCRQHYDHMLVHHRNNTPSPVDLPNRVERSMIEEFTGELVRWQEDLPLEDYERDVLPCDVEPEVRALAEVCLVLMNSNEFLYLR